MAEMPANEIPEPVEPALPASQQQGNPQYCVYPGERSQWALDHCANREPACFVNQVYGCRNIGPYGTFTITTTFSIEVKELVYPGGPDDLEHPEGKWVYVFREQELVAYARALSNGYWRGTTGAKSGGQQWTCKGGVRLDPGPEGNRHLYWFFLSPVELTQKALDYLVQHRDFTRIAVSCRADSYGKSVWVSDPFHWTADVHRLYYQPAVAKYQELLGGEEPVAQAFIASVLKRWIEDGDKEKVKTYLKSGEPDAWLEKRQQELKDLKSKAEAAAAYLAYCVDSPEHRAVEMACQERGGEALELCLQAWASCSSDLNQTEAGKELARSVAWNPERFPRKYLFFDEEGPPKLAFKEGKWTWTAAVAIFEKLLPGYIAVKVRKGHLNAEKVEQAIVKYLKNIGIPTKKGSLEGLSRYEKKVVRGIAAGDQAIATAGGKLGRAYQKLAAEAGVANKVPQRYFAEAEKAEKVHKNYEKSFQKLAASVDVVLKLANLYVAIQKYRDQKEKDGHDSLVAALSVGATATTTVSACIEELVMAEARKMILKRIASVATMVSGAIDAYEFGEEFHEAAVGERDYGKAAGRGMQAIGSATIVVSSAIALGSAVFGASAMTGPGLIAGFAGAGLIIGGALVVSFFSLNPNQQFARGCFLRKSTTEGRPYWAYIKLPLSSAVDEAKVLAQLLANFRVEASAGNYPPWSITIKPGFLLDDSKFQVEIKTTYKPSPASKEPSGSACYTLEINNSEIRQLSGHPLSKYELSEREGLASEIYIELEPRGYTWVSRFNALTGQTFHAAEVKIRLLLDKEEKLTVPFEKALILRLPECTRAHSLEQEKWASLSDEKHSPAASPAIGLPGSSLKGVGGSP